MLRDTKYILAYLLPLTAALGLYYGGVWSLGSVYLAFGVLPMLELVLPASAENHPATDESNRSRKRLFDWLLYLNLPLLYGLVGFYLYRMGMTEVSVVERIGMTFNVGVAIGSMGINVGHELGHRTTKWEPQLAKLLLLPGLYQHFIIEHNFGHHRNIATPADPASARRGQTVYGFWWQSVLGGYASAWRIESRRLQRAGQAFWSWHNAMLRYSLYTFTYLLVVGFVFGAATVAYAIAAGIIGFLLLETVNYVEHYGLRRRQLPGGRYEPVTQLHSWNSDHELGRIFLYELTRHSDHHFKATRKYQILRHFEESPQLPLGYPACMLLALVPPAWFALMDERIPQPAALTAA